MGRFSFYHIMRDGLFLTVEGRQIQSFSLLGETLGFALRHMKQIKADVNGKEKEKNGTK